MTEIQNYEPILPAVPDVPPTQVEWIAKVRQNPVLRMDDTQAENAVVLALVKLAPYLSETPENHVSREFAKVFKEAYPLLNPMECKAAVMMQTTGKLGESDSRIFYGGKFSISTMCAILNAYQEWRQKVVAAIIHAEDEARKEQERLKQKAAWIEALAVDKAAFLRGEYGELYSWQDVPAEWFDWAMAEKLIELTNAEKRERVEQAKIEAANELNAQNENTRRDGRIGEILKGAQFESSVEARARIIQRKRAVWDKLANK